LFFSGEFLCRFDYDGLFFQDGLFLLLYDGMDIKLVMGKVVDGMMFQVEEKIGILGFGEGGRVDEFGVVDLQDGIFESLFEVGVCVGEEVVENGGALVDEGFVDQIHFHLPIGGDQGGEAGDEEIPIVFYPIRGPVLQDIALDEGKSGRRVGAAFFIELEQPVVTKKAMLDIGGVPTDQFEEVTGKKSGSGVVVVEYFIIYRWVVGGVEETEVHQR